MSTPKNERMELLTSQDVAVLLGVGAERIRQMERAGHLVAAVRTPRGWRLFDRREVEKLAAKRAGLKTPRVQAGG